MTTRVTKAMLEEQNAALLVQNEELAARLTAVENPPFAQLAGKVQDQMLGGSDLYYEFAAQLVQRIRDEILVDCCGDVREALYDVLARFEEDIQEALSNY